MACDMKWISSHNHKDIATALMHICYASVLIQVVIRLKVQGCQSEPWWLCYLYQSLLSPASVVSMTHLTPGLSPTNWQGLLQLHC